MPSSPAWPRWPARFDVSVTIDRRPAGISVHLCKALTGRDVRVQLRIRATSPARTILDCAPGLYAAGTLTRVANDALLTRFLTRSQLADVRHRFSTHPGAKLLDAFTDRADGPTRSEMEDRFLAFCERYGLPRPAVNTYVAGHEVDAVFVAERVIVELDSWRYHSDRGAFEADRDRDADTLAAGYVTVRITWERLSHRPCAEADRLRRILAR